MLDRRELAATPDRGTEPARIASELDFLSRTLWSLPSECTLSGPLTRVAPWEEVPALGRPVFHCVLEGECRIRLEDGLELDLRAGEAVLLPTGRAHRIGSGPAGEAGEFPRGRSSTLLTGRYFIEHPSNVPLLNSLSPAIRLSGGEASGSSELQFLLALLGEECGGPHPGAVAAREALARVLLVLALRAEVEEGRAGPWLGALTDPEIGPVLKLLEGQLSDAWEVAGLARHAGMSRSAFAAKFRLLVGQPPLAYLHEQRMRKAGDLLRRGEIGLKEIAARVGYSSDSALSAAFRNWAGCSPGQYRRAEGGERGAGLGAPRETSGRPRRRPDPPR